MQLTSILAVLSTIGLAAALPAANITARQDILYTVNAYSGGCSADSALFTYYGSQPALAACTTSQSMLGPNGGADPSSISFSFTDDSYKFRIFSSDDCSDEDFQDDDPICYTAPVSGGPTGIGAWIVYT